MYVYNLLHEPLLGSLRQMLENTLNRSTVEAVPWQVCKLSLWNLRVLVLLIGSSPDCSSMPASILLTPVFIEYQHVA
jgi:hypothetical protein